MYTEDEVWRVLTKNEVVFLMFQHLRLKTACPALLSIRNYVMKRFEHRVRVTSFDVEMAEWIENNVDVECEWTLTRIFFRNSGDNYFECSFKDLETAVMFRLRF